MSMNFSADITASADASASSKDSNASAEASNSESLPPDEAAETQRRHWRAVNVTARKANKRVLGSGTANIFATVDGVDEP